MESPDGPLLGVLAAIRDGVPVTDTIDAIAARVAALSASSGAGSRVRVVVAGASGPTRVYGRDIDLPRRVVLALDRVASASTTEPGRSDAPDASWASEDTDFWSAAQPDLVRAGLGLPLLLPLREGTATVGVMAVFPPLGLSASPIAADVAAERLAPEPWPTIAGLALARELSLARLRRSSVEDGVTGLPTRSLLTARLREALHARPRRRLALVQIALDRLGPLDDAVGSEGEELIRIAGQRTQAVVRPGDVVGHLRPNALAVICDGVGPDEAIDIGERVSRALTLPMTVGGRDLAATPGVGVVVAESDDTVNSLIRKADIAARESAGLGGAQTIRYRPGTYEAALAKVEVEDDLRRAIAAGELRLVYQPQVSLADGRIVGVEALVRWQHPTRGLVGPDEFIAVAEETGLVVELGAWAVGTALADMARGLDTVVSVNLSARQLDDLTLLDRVTASLDRHGVDPARLRLEITESALARDLERSQALLRTLRELGVRVSIDDFGTGYASLEQLRQTEVADSLKLDRTFVAGIAVDARDRAIVAAAITLGRSLGFSVVAEGVEDQAQVAILRALGCDAAQGYLYGVPVPLESLDLTPR